MKQHSICSSTRNMKQMHDYTSHFGDGDLMGFSWPPRSYICSFCKRDFRSAQALGGHMNVHRRDRARLRQSPPRDGQFSLLNLNLEPSPTVTVFPTNPSSSPPLSKFPPFTSKIPPPSAITNCRGDIAAVPVQIRRPITIDLMKLNAASGVETSSVSCKRSGFVSLELGMGLISPSMEELDLELRLGYN